MKKILVNYNFTPDKKWIGDDYLIFDRSDNREYLKDFDQDKIIQTENIGQVDYDKLMYLVNNYDTLPEVFLWGKTNLFKYVTQEEYDKLKNSNTFTPLLTQNHRIYSDNVGPVNYYSQGLYWERNNSWYVNQFPSRYFDNFHEFSWEFNIDDPSYIPFAPGGNYILTREKVHRYSRDFYERMANLLPYAREPAEAQMCERSYYLLWK